MADDEPDVPPSPAPPDAPPDLRSPYELHSPVESDGAPSPAPAAATWLEQKLEEQNRRLLAMGEREKAELSPLVAGVKSDLAQPRPQMGKLERVPEAPKTPDPGGENASNWLTAAMVLSSIAGAFSRQPATVALTAFAGAINGFKQGQLEKSEADFKAWKAASEKVIANNKLVQDQYLRAMQDRKTSLDEKMAQIQVISAQYKDQIMYEAAVAKNYTLVAQLMEKSQEFRAKMEDGQNKIVEKFEQALFLKSATQAGKPGTPEWLAWYDTLTPERKAEVDKAAGGRWGAAGIALSDDSAELRAQRALKGDVQGAYMGLGYGNTRAANTQKIDEAINRIGTANGWTKEQIAEVLNQARGELAGTIQEQRTLGTMEARMGSAAIEAKGAIALARGAIENVPRTQSLTLNQLIQGWQNQTLEPAQRELYTRIQGVVNTYAAVMARGYNVPTVEARQSAHALLPPTLDAASFNRVLDTMESEINMAIDSPDQFRELLRRRNVHIGDTGAGARPPLSSTVTPPPSATRPPPAGGGATYYDVGGNRVP